MSDETSGEQPTQEQPAVPDPRRHRLVRKLAVAGSAAVLAIGVGLGIGGVGTGGGNATSSAQNAAATTGGTRDGGGAGGPGSAGAPAGQGLAKLASALGVSEAKLRAAMQAGRSSGTRPSPDTMAADLAKQLGLSQATVAAALQASMPAPPSGGGAGAPGGTTS